MNIVEKLKSALTRRRDESVASYASLLESAVKGEPFPEAQALAILEEASVTPEQFGADVELKRQRIEWAAAHAKRALADQERQRLEAAIAANTAEHARQRDALLAKFEAKAAELQSELRGAEAVISKADHAARSLVERPDPAFRNSDSSPWKRRERLIVAIRQRARLEFQHEAEGGPKPPALEPLQEEAAVLDGLVLIP